MNMSVLTPREEKKLLKHIEKWGVPYEKYIITYLPSTRFSPSFLYFNTEKYQIRFDTDESSTGGIPNIVKRQFELRGENSYSLNKDEPHIRNAINKGYYCPCNDPIYYSQCSEEKLEEIKLRLGTSFPIENV
jgi:hypothetical protein